MTGQQHGILGRPGKPAHQQLVPQRHQEKHQNHSDRPSSLLTQQKNADTEEQKDELLHPGHPGKNAETGRHKQGQFASGIGVKTTVHLPTHTAPTFAKCFFSSFFPNMPPRMPPNSAKTTNTAMIQSGVRRSMVSAYSWP